jgi:hypothetical protein
MNRNGRSPEEPIPTTTSPLIRNQVPKSPFWQVGLNATLNATTRLAAGRRQSSHVRAWLSSYDDSAVVSSNAGALEVPFQRWLKFKEAFSPKFVVDALASVRRTPRSCIDPFGGSGTTALTCSLLGVRAVTMEVNPFLADLIEAKITKVDPTAVVSAYAEVTHSMERDRRRRRQAVFDGPKSLREPGFNGRYVYSAEAFDRLVQTRDAIDRLAEPTIRRLLRVLLGSILVETSNVVVNGKGRRYRGGWQRRRVDAFQVDELFANAVRMAARDMAEFGSVMTTPATVLRGDCRVLLEHKLDPVDIALFSPPYPNSFDYTDVYNLELWMLGYLTGSADNRRLRISTLRSHVQVQWERRSPTVASESPLLQTTLARLERSRELLWDARLVEMVADYFADMSTVLGGLRRSVRKGGRVVAVVGDSCYAGIRVDTAGILSDVARRQGFLVRQRCRIRSMRASAQHGGGRKLSEDCLVLDVP